MRSTNIAVFGLFADNGTVEQCIDALRNAGFRDTDVSLLVPDNSGTKEFAHEKHTKAPEGAVAGGGSGAMIGAAAGWLAGMGSLMVPGLEAVAQAGPVIGMLSGMGAGVCLGGFTGALFGMSMPEYEARRYAGMVRKGGILMSVHCDNPTWARNASSVLKRSGARSVSMAPEAKADFARSKKPMPRSRMQPSS